MEFLILGPLEVRNGEHTVRLGAAKQRALLGVLLLHANEAVSTARLVDELWGETPPTTAEKLVQGYVHALRKQLGDGVVQTQAPGYRLSVEANALDLAEFERLIEAARAAPADSAIELRRSALALWRGPPLADVVLEGPERHNVGRLSELLLATQIEQLGAELELGRHVEVVGELEALLAEHPYQERVAGLLMLALYRSGRQADALEVYRSVRGRLDDELGLEPSQELRELEAAILRQDESLASPRQAPLQAPSDETAPTAVPAPARSRRRLAAAAALAVFVIAAIVAAVFVLRDDAAPIVVPPNSLAAIDPATNRVVKVIQTGIRPGPVAAGAGSVWVGNLDGRSLTRVDPSTRTVAGTIPLPATPTAVDVGRGAVWVMNGRLGTLYKIDPQFETREPVEFGTRSIRNSGAGVDLGEGSVWVAYGDSTLGQVHPETLDAEAAATAGAAPAGLVVAYGFVWVANSGDETVRRFSPQTYELGDIESITVCRTPSGIAAGAGSIWVSCAGDDRVERLPAGLSPTSTVQIPVGHGPTSVAFGAGAVWVANTAAGTVSRIDPATNREKAIDVGNSPAGIFVYRGLVWVSVQAPPDEASSP
jgi:DNA-binding SARP family transcriptional activator/DNA-binding beta-propeller fold protein YncE